MYEDKQFYKKKYKDQCYMFQALRIHSSIIIFRIFMVILESIAI